MRTGRIVAAVVVTVMVVVLGLTLTYAGADWGDDSSQTTTRPAAVLTLTVTGPGDASERSVTLECQPAGGDHPDAEAACRDLREAGGDFMQLRQPDKACTMEANPVEVRASGQWDGATVSYQEEFGNPCVVQMETRAVFQF